MAIRLTDTSTQYLYRTTDLLPYNADYTIMAWIYQASDPGVGVYNNFFCLYNGSLDLDGLQLARLVFNVASNRSGGGYVEQSGSTLSTATWYHVAMVRSGSNLYGYLNGVQDVTVTRATTASSTAQMNLGAWYGPGDYADTRFMAIKAWSAALSVNQIKTEMRTIQPKYRTSLYGWWPGYPGATERYRDYNGTGRTWTASGTPTDEAPGPVSWGGQAQAIPYVSAAGETLLINVAYDNPAYWVAGLKVIG